MVELKSFFVWGQFYVLSEGFYHRRGKDDLELLSGQVEIVNGNNPVVARITLCNVLGLKVLLKADQLGLLEELAETNESVCEFLQTEGSNEETLEFQLIQ